MGSAVGQAHLLEDIISLVCETQLSGTPLVLEVLIAYLEFSLN